MSSATAQPRRRIRTGVGVAILAAATLTSTGQLTHASAATTGSPTLTFANNNTQSTLGAAYTKALTNLLTTNTVTYDPGTYNSSGLMTNPPGTFVRAGGGYAQPWTRDASVNSWNAASLLEPQVAANTLWSAVVKMSNGQLEVVQDNETWDQVIWMVGAWNHYLVTGDRTFLANAYQTATNTMALHRNTTFNSTYGLYTGPAFFNDGIAGYPAPPADATESHGGYVGDYSATASMMTLSTNEIYYQALRSTALMASALGKSASEVGGYNTQADTLKTKINQYLWLPSKGMYGYFVHGSDSMSGQVDQTEEGTGLSFAILFGIANAAQAQSIMRNTDVQPYGIADTYPNFARYSTAQPGRHNVSIWPMVEGYWADAAATAGNQNRFATEVQTLAGLANTSGGFYEVYNAQTGVPDGGWQTGGHWGPLADQTWSASAYLRMIYTDTFGLKFTTDGITFAPTLPWGWGDATLSGVKYRNATLNIALHGSGNVISQFLVDGASSSLHSISSSLSGTHTIDITLTGGKPSPIVAGVSSSLCVDATGNSSANGAAVELWTCNGGTNQQASVIKANNTIRILGKCLDATGGGTANGTRIQLWDCAGVGAQTWVPQTNGTLVNPQSGRCIDDPASSTTPGVQLALWDCNSGANQRWSLPSASAITGLAGLCADATAAGTANGTAVETWTCNGQTNQQWTASPADSTVSQLGKCLDVSGGSTANGGLVQLWDCNGTGAQVWQPQSNGSLLNPQSGKCLDIPGASTTPGVQLEIYTCNGGGNQQWVLPPSA